MTDPTQFTWSHLLYRLYDADGDLLYVGRTSHFPTRMYSHSGVQPWWQEVGRAVVETFPDFESLDAAERTAIREEAPRYNTIRYVPPVPRPEDRPPARPRRRRVRPAEMPTDDAVLVRPVDRVCVSGGAVPSFFANYILLVLRSFMDDDVYETNRVTLSIDELAVACRAKRARVVDALDHLVRAGWLVDRGGGTFDCTIPQAVFELGDAACKDGARCLIHGGQRDEVGPVAPVLVS